MSKLLQLRYYVGEESRHDKGYGIAPGNIHSMREDITNRFLDFKLGDCLYLINGSVLEIPKLEERSEDNYYNKGWGQLGIRIINQNQKSIKKTTKLLELPFSERLIVPYDFL